MSSLVSHQKLDLASPSLHLALPQRMGLPLLRLAHRESLNAVRGGYTSQWVCASGTLCRSLSLALRTPCPQACTLLLLVLFIYDVFFVFITPFLTKVGPFPPHPRNP